MVFLSGGCRNASTRGRYAPRAPSNITRQGRELQLDDAAPHADGDGVGAVAGPQFLHDVLDVDLDRLFRDEELLGDVAVPVPARDGAQDLDFARRESFVAQVLGEVGDD